MYLSLLLITAIVGIAIAPFSIPQYPITLDTENHYDYQVCI
ncbi:MAG: hypothetical protein V7K98_19520 [Nostoc sp.]